MNRTLQIALIAILASAGSTFDVHKAHAATLIIVPDSFKVSAGNIVSADIIVDTSGVAINDSEAAISFPTDLLQVMSVNKGSSIFSLWVEDPKFSNIDGTITYSGGAPNPGYTGKNGKIISVVFKAKKQGNATLVFSDATVRKNDGLGTDVLSLKRSATIQIGASPVEVPIVPATTAALPAKPVITSTTHPQQNAWYSATTASFDWTIPAGVTSIETLIDKKPDTTPTVAYDRSVSQRTVNDMADGVWYFHLRYMNSAGWGPTSHYKVQIDSTPPEKFSLDTQTKRTVTFVTLDAKDAMSGIDSYSIQIDGGQIARVQDSDLVDHQYQLPIQNQGGHSLSVRAYDKAGNSTESTAAYVSPGIIQPTISVVPQRVTVGDAVTVHGNTLYPRATAYVFVQSVGNDTQPYNVPIAADGSFTIDDIRLKDAGTTRIWSQVVFSNDVRSPLSDKASVQVDETMAVQTSKSAMYLLSFIIPVILLAIGLLLMLYVGWHRFFGLRRTVRRETLAVIGEAHRALNQFKDELNTQLIKLEKVKVDRVLNKKEEKAFKDLKANIDSIDEFIESRLKKLIK